MYLQASGSFGEIRCKRRVSGAVSSIKQVVRCRDNKLVVPVPSVG